MAHKLITFLGRGAPSKDGQRLPYRSARYRFEGLGAHAAWTSDPVPNLAPAIAQYQKSLGSPLNSISVFGTAGSMWDVLLEQSQAPEDDFGMTLIEQIDDGSTTNDTLRQVEELISTNEVAYRLHLMPPAVTASGQAQLLSSLVDEIDSDDLVWIDVTNGYRHLPMLGLASASLAARTKGARIEQISYGAFEMTEARVTPVISLAWMLKLLQVSASVHGLIRNRQLRPIIDCFPGGPVREALVEAEFFLSTMRVAPAIEKVNIAIRELRNWGETTPAELQPVIGLLIESLQPLTRQERTVGGLVDMADHALRSGDYLRTSVFLYEAVQIANADKLPGDPKEDWRLTRIRNFLAHSGNIEYLADTREVLQSPKDLRQFFQSHIDRLRRDCKSAR